MANAHTIADDLLYVGIDIGKTGNVAGFVSNTLLNRHERFENCPAIAFEQSREGYRKLIDVICYYVPIEQCFVLMEVTGHYHKALQQYLLELEIPVYLMHVQKRMSGMMKTDKRDALGLANHLYNQLEKGIQMSEKKQVAKRMIPDIGTAAELRNLILHRTDLARESTRKKNKLTAIADELFPELTQVFADPNSETALGYREQFPTPHALANASVVSLCALRRGTFPSNKQIARLQALAAQSIGCKDINRQRGLVFEQSLLIRELRMTQENIQGIEQEIVRILTASREGKILLSIPSMGYITAATIISSIGNIANFETAGHLKSYFGWSPTVKQSGKTIDTTKLVRGGTKIVKSVIYLFILQTIQKDTEWAKIYQRLLTRQCRFDERRRRYVV